MTTRVAVRRGAALRGYAYTFIELFSPRLNRKLIETALAGKAEAYEL
jgi:LysR family cys regulon transcriptional activator